MTSCQEKTESRAEGSLEIKLNEAFSHRVNVLYTHYAQSHHTVLHFHQYDRAAVMTV